MTSLTESECQQVHVELAERSYDIVIASGRLNAVAGEAGGWLASRLGAEAARRSVLIVTDRNVSSHASVVAGSFTEAGWTVEQVQLEPGEKTKSLDVISGLYDRMVAMKADRRTVVVAVGGGVIGDASGFLAATYNRGVPFVQVPTTHACSLLA